MSAPLQRLHRLVVFPILAALTCVGCKPRENEEAQRRSRYSHDFLTARGGANAWGLVLNPDIRFKEGFCPLEFERTETAFTRAVRWMGEHGVVQVRGPAGKAMTLYFAGRVPGYRTHALATIEVSVDGEFAGSVEAGGDRFHHSLVVHSNKLPTEWVDIGFTASSYLTEPIGVCRQFGLSIEEIRWEPVATAP